MLPLPTGGVPGPWDAWLVLRGTKTLHVRMETHNRSGMAIARFLEDHGACERVYYPGLASHPYHEIARRQMRGFGGLVTFEVRDADWKATAAVVDAAKIARIAPSLGGVESLIEQPLVMSYFEVPAEDRRRFGISDNMIRLSCGIENTEDLVEDLRQALEAK